MVLKYLFAPAITKGGMIVESNIEKRQKSDSTRNVFYKYTQRTRTLE